MSSHLGHHYLRPISLREKEAEVTLGFILVAYQSDLGLKSPKEVVDLPFIP